MPHSLDALDAAPNHHRLLLENEFVRILDTRVEPGDTVPLHTHRNPAACYILSWSDFLRRDENGRITLDSRSTPVKAQSGQASWLAPLGPHTLENIGGAPLHVISVEIKPPQLPPIG